MSNVWQQTVDNFWQAALIKFLPPQVKPWWFTLTRFILIPLILLALSAALFALAGSLFALAALADSLDGSLARIRRQESSWGAIFDPLADKLLFMLTAIFLAYFYPHPWLLLFSLVPDFLLGLAGLIFLVWWPDKKIPQSNWVGKSKMLFEVLAVLTIFIFLLWPLACWLWWSWIFLYLAIIFGLDSLVVYSMMAISQN